MPGYLLVCNDVDVVDSAGRSIAALMIAGLAGAGLEPEAIFAHDPFSAIAFASGQRSIRRIVSDPAELVSAPPALAVLPQVAREDLATVSFLVGCGVSVLLGQVPPFDSPDLRSLQVDTLGSGAEIRVAFPLRANDIRVPDPIYAGSPVTGFGPVWSMRGARDLIDALDLLRQLAGDILAVNAVPERMPAAQLATGEQVELAALFASGHTALVNRRGRLRLGCSELAGDTTLTRRPVRMYSLIGEALSSNQPRPVLGTIGDLLAVHYALDAWRLSASSGNWVELG